MNNKNRNFVCIQSTLYKLKKNHKSNSLFASSLFALAGCYCYCLFAFFATRPTLWHLYHCTTGIASPVITEVWRCHRTNGKIPTDFGGLGLQCGPRQQHSRNSTAQTRDFLAHYLGQIQFEWVCPSMDFSMGTLHITQLSICSLLNPAVKKYLRSTNSGVWDIILWLQLSKE